MAEPPGEDGLERIFSEGSGQAPPGEGGAFAQDAAKACGDMCKVILENEHVRVLDYHVKPGGKVPMHSHPPAVTYYMTDAKLKTTLADGKVMTVDVKAGDAKWSDAVTHANENIGTTEGHVIVVEMKEAAKK